MQPGWSRKRKSLQGYSDVVGSSSYAQDLYDEEKRNAAARARAADAQPASNSVKVNPDGTITKDEPGFLDYLNPFGEYGLFGKRNTAQVANTATKAGEVVRQGVDSLLGEEGNDKFDSGKDIARFALNLLPGMVEGLATSGKDFHEMASGKRLEVDESGNLTGKEEDLTGAQRAAAGVVGALNSFGIAAGGSGKFFKEILRRPLEDAAKGATKSVVAQTAKGIAKNSAIEGTEEAVQSVAEDIQDDSQLSDDWATTAAKGFALGAAAGGIFDVSGRAIGATKDAVKTRSVNKKTGTSAEVRAEISKKVNEAENLTDEQRTAYTNRLTEIAREVEPVKDGKSKIEEFNARTADTLNSVISPDGKTQNTASSTKVDVQPTVDTKRLVRVDAQMNKQLDYVYNELDKLKNGTDSSIKRLVASDGTDVTSVSEKFDSEIRQRETQIRDLQQQAAGISNVTEAATPKEGTDPSEFTGDVEGRAKAAEEVMRLRQEIEGIEAQRSQQFEMLGGTQEITDPALAKAKFKELNMQRATIQDWKIRNNLGETPESLQNLKNDLENGVVSEEFVQMREPINSVQAAVSMARESDLTDASQIQQSAVINQIHREAAQQKLSRLYTQDKHDAYIAELDANTKAAEQLAKDYPKPKKDAELEALYADYEAQSLESQRRLEEDAPEVEAAQRALEIADDIDSRIVDHANSLLESDPVAFGAVDAENMIEIKSAVDVALTLKKSESSPETITPVESYDAVTQAVRNTDDTDGVSTIIEEDPRLTEQAAVVVADQLGNGNMKGALRDTFLRTTRDALLRLENGDKLVNILDSAIGEMSRSDDTMKTRAIVDKWKRAYKSKEAETQTIAFLDKGVQITRMDGESESRFNTRQTAVNSIKEYLDDARERRGLKTNKQVDEEIAILEQRKSELSSSEGMYIDGNPSKELAKNIARIDEQIEALNSQRAVDHYFPHIFNDTGIDVESVAEALARLEANKNSNGKKLTQKQRDMLNRKIEGIDLGLQQVIAQRKIYSIGKDGNAIKRTGATGWSTDIPFVLDVYQRATNRSVYMQPAFDQIQKMTSNLDKAQLQFVEKALSAVKGEKFGSDVFIGDKTKKVLSGTRRLSNAALMGASIRTVVLQPFSIINNWRLDAEQGGGTAQFIASTFKALTVVNDPRGLAHSPALQEFMEAGGMQGSWSTSLKAGATTKAENVLFSGIALMDRNMRFAAYDQGRSTWLKNNAKNPKKPTDAEIDSAKRAGVEAAHEAQFGLGPLDIPLAQNTEINKAIFQLQQFNMKQFEKEAKFLIGTKDSSLVKITKDSDGKVQSVNFTKKGAKNMIKTLAGYSLMYALYTQLEVGEDSKNPFGLGPEDMLPFGEQLTAMWQFVTGQEVDEVQAVLPPIYTAFLGRGGRDKGIVGNLKAAMTGGDDVDRGEELSKALQGAFRQFVPAGTQINRTIGGAQAITRGESMNSSGSTRFMVDNQNGWNIMKGLVAGQYATTEGQEWLEKGMNTIPKSMTIETDAGRIPVSEYVRNNIQDPEMKAKYIGYFSTKVSADKQLKKNNLGTSDVVTSIRERLTAGSISQAQADNEIDRHNQLLLDLYRPYINSVDSLPAYVSLDLQDNVLVDYVKPINYR